MLNCCDSAVLILSLLRICIGLLGDCYTEAGDLEKAMHFYDKCVQLD